MARRDVREVLDLVRNLGLEPIMESGRGHYKVRDPKTGVYLFGISSSPSDPNWRWMIMRHLRRLGLLRDKKKGGRRAPKQKSAIDLDALKRAQDAAAAAGQRIPTLDDLEDSTEFFSRIKTADKSIHYSVDAQEEVIDIMTATDAPRLNFIKQRLTKFLEEHDAVLAEQANARLEAQGKKSLGGRGARTEFVRIAIEEVAPKRRIRAWKSVSSGQQTLHSLLDLDAKGITIWVATLLEATMDHIDGLKWGEVDETRKLPTAPETAFTPRADDEVTMVKAPEPVVFTSGGVPVTEALIEKLSVEAAHGYEPESILPVTTLDLTTDGVREAYASILLEHLRNSPPDKLPKEVLDRLDRMVGLA